MRYVLFILIGFLGLFLTQTARGADCSSGDILILTPPSGTTTIRDSVTIRGFLCENHALVLIRNETTDHSTLTVTDEECDDGSCIYRFVARVRGLAPGINDITASVPDEDPPIETGVEIIRTALAWLER